MVCEALRSKGHRTALVDLFFGMEGRDPAVDPYEAPVPQEFKKVSPQAPDLNEVRRSRKDQSPSAIGPGVLELCAGADVVFLALHGSCGEDGRIQAALDLLGVPYTGAGCLASAIAMDKDMTKRLVSGLVTTPRWETVTVTADNLEELVEQTPLPAVVKPIASGSSIGVTIAHDRAALRRGLEESMALGGRTVLEQYIKGREIQVAVLDGKALPSIEIIPQADFYDYENKYQPAPPKRCAPRRPPGVGGEGGPGGPDGVRGHRAVGVRPGGLHRHPGRHPLLFGDQHPARHDPHQPGAPGGGGGGH